jgi:alkylhydroperoxidase family enzyme
MRAHSAVAESALGPGTMQPILDDHRTAPIDERLRAMLTLLETFTLHPERLGPDDVRLALDAGVTREAVRDAFYVAFLFNTYDRLADTLGWELPDPSYYAKAGPFLLKKGYL